MKTTLQAISWMALVATIAPSIAFLLGGLSLEASKTLLFWATAAWFASAPWWIDRKS